MKKTIDQSLWKFEIRKLSDLVKNPNNPREITKETLKGVRESLKRNGYIDRIVINNQNMILSGHARYEVLLEQFEPDTEVEVLVATRDLTKDEEENVLLGMNTQGGKWDMKLLSLNFDPIKLDDFGIDFKRIESEKEIEEVECPDIDDTNKPICRLGEVWILGNHRLMCGDATIIDDVEKLSNNTKMDLFITDPPYNVEYEGKTKDKLKIQNDSMSDDNFMKFLIDSFTCANAFMRDGAVFYIWHADSEGYNFRSACKNTSWKIRECLIWVKNSMVMGRQDYQWKHEPCLYGWKDGASHIWNSDRKQTTVLEFNKPSANKEHPTMKPIELFAYQIKNSSLENNTVLDLFGGSGTTIIACEQLNRKCYTMELDPKYCDVIIKRWEKFTGKQAKRESDGSLFKK